jgi:hypothetical protein
LGKKRLKVQLKRLQDDTTDGFSGWDDADVEQDDEFLGTAHNSGTSTKQSTPPNYASHEHKSPAACTTVKLQDVTKKLHEISLFTRAQVTRNNNKDNNNAVPVKATPVTSVKAKEATTAATAAATAAPALKDPKN